MITEITNSPLYSIVNAAGVVLRSNIHDYATASAMLAMLSEADQQTARIVPMTSTGQQVLFG